MPKICCQLVRASNDDESDETWLVNIVVTWPNRINSLSLSDAYSLVKNGVGGITRYGVNCRSSPMEEWQTNSVLTKEQFEGHYVTESIF